MMTANERRAIAKPLRRALRYWVAAGYSSHLTGMTLWLHHAIPHYLATRNKLTREEVANFLHKYGWGPDDDSIWRPKNKLNGVKSYYTEADGQLRVVPKRGYDRKTRRS